MVTARPRLVKVKRLFLLHSLPLTFLRHSPGAVSRGHLVRHSVGVEKAGTAQAKIRFAAPPLHHHLELARGLVMPSSACPPLVVFLG